VCQNGIRHLNRYLRDNCSESIRCINLSELSGKKIVVDISIYLYKYEAEDALLENMYVMLSIFNHYNITPIFVFDGKPPPEKKALLQKRREDKENAQEEYDNLQKQLESKTEEDDKQEIISAMILLKKQLVQINKEKIESVKSLIRAFGATYYDAPGEADELCAMLVIKKKVWACLSEDMDLFVYGCTRVLRYFSIMAHTVVLYYTKGILEELKMTQKEFKEICVLSGTDYNMNANGNNDKVNLKLTMRHFKKFKESESKDFYEWLLANTSYINDIQILNKINDMFNLQEEREKLAIFNKIKIANGPVRQEEIEEIMKQEDFMFCKYK
jgi:5'-3' exonuclease